MDANTLIVFTASLLGVLISAVVVGAIFTLDYIAGNRKEVTHIMTGFPGTSEMGGYPHWLPYINKQKKKSNELRGLFVRKAKHMVFVLGFCVTFGVLLPGALSSAGIERWHIAGKVDALNLAYLAVALLSVSLLSYVSLSFIRGFPGVESLEKEEIDDLSEEYYQKRHGLLWDRVTIPHANPDWVWRATADPNNLIVLDSHERRIRLDLDNRGSVVLMQTLESQKGIHLEGGGNLGWRLSSISLSGPYDSRTAHIRGYRGKMHVEGDYFDSKEEVLPIADEWLEWAIREWRKIDADIGSEGGAEE